MAYASEAEAILLVYANDFAKGLGLTQLNFNDSALRSAILTMEANFPHNDGLENASPFKKAATFITYFVAERPIEEPFPVETLKSLTGIKNHQNAIFAFEYAIDMLHGAVIKRSDGKEVTLENRINVSHHSYRDIIDALSVITPQSHFQLVSVLLEQLAYRANNDASYPVGD